MARHKSRYEEALREMETLLKEKEALKNKELFKAISKSSRSYDEIISFLRGNDLDDSNES